jgi:hypothetical protein
MAVGAQTAVQTAVGEKMSLYDALRSLPTDKRLRYEGPRGATALISVDVTTSGALYIVLRAQAHDSMGNPRVTTRGYAISTRVDCRDLEQALRDLGVDPDHYRVV